MTNFYCYQQNSPNVIVNDKLTLTVIIEADSEEDADSYAKNLGIEFDEEDGFTETRWDTAKGYTCLESPGPFIRGSRHFDEKKVNVGQAFCYLYDAEGLKHSFVRAS